MADKIGDRFYKNLRLKKARIVFSDGTAIDKDFLDNRAMQYVKIRNSRTSYVKIVVEDVYREGDSKLDLAISEIKVWGYEEDKTLEPQKEKLTIVPKHDRERFRFSKGGISQAFTINLTPGVSKAYLLNIREGQSVSITTSKRVTIGVLDPQDEFLVSASSGSQWTVAIPETGDYTVIFAGQGQVTVTICISPPSESEVPSPLQGYKTYCNARYGFRVNYPCYLRMEPPPDNDDGRKFYDGKGFLVIVSGSNNVLDETLESEMDSQGKDFDRITYSTTGKNWFVLSGYKSSEVVYVKTYIGQGSINHLYIQYPSRHSVEYDNVVTNISRSFKPGNLNDAH